MKKNLTGIVINTLFWLVQIVILVGVIALEDVAGKKMGVLRHVTYKKSVYESTYFTPDLMRLYTWILVLLGIFALLLSVYNIVKGKNKIIKRWSMTTVAINLGGLLYIIMVDSQALRAYHYFLIVTFIIVGLHHTRLLIGIITFDNSKMKKELLRV
ncbi:MAG: hypothetical protein JJT76_00210 [Clostridiaceae bacterium]|nr:hypothetical protein [Clostridiaceae bacterium]